MCQGTMYWMTASKHIDTHTHSLYKLHQLACHHWCKLLAEVVIRPVNFLSQTFSAAAYALSAKLMQ